MAEGRLFGTLPRPLGPIVGHPEGLRQAEEMLGPCLNLFPPCGDAPASTPRPLGTDSAPPRRGPRPDARGPAARRPSRASRSPSQRAHGPPLGAPLYLARGAGFLPRIKPVGALGEAARLAGLPGRDPAPAPAPRAGAADRQAAEGPAPTSPRAQASNDLADSLADLMGESSEEGGDAREESRTTRRRRITRPTGSAQKTSSTWSPFPARGRSPHTARRDRPASSRRWPRHGGTADPPSGDRRRFHPGSRAATGRRLMEAGGPLPQGRAGSLPGNRRDMPPAIWGAPARGAARRAGRRRITRKFRLAKFAERLGLDPRCDPRTARRRAPEGTRGRSCPLPCARHPSTDQWLAEGPQLQRRHAGADRRHLLEAPGRRRRSRRRPSRCACANGPRGLAAPRRSLSHDRTLTRQVTAALSRWAIRPDDKRRSALSLSPPGRFCAMFAELEGEAGRPRTLAVILKHPALQFEPKIETEHMRRTHEISRSRSCGPRARPADAGAAFVDWAVKRKNEPCDGLGAWLCDHLLAEARTLPCSHGAAASHRHRAKGPRRWAARFRVPKCSRELYDKDAGAAA